MRITLNPYLYFNGTCREAMEFYTSVFGGTLTVQTYAEAHMPEGTNPDWLIHAHLTGGDATLMGSDTDMASPEAKKIELSLSGDDEPRLREIFDRLSDGGTVTQPLTQEFWGDIFGKVTDKYGIIWMVNIAMPKE